MARSKIVNIRVSSEDLIMWQKEARKRRLSMSEWVRRMCRFGFADLKPHHLEYMNAMESARPSPKAA